MEPLDQTLALWVFGSINLLIEVRAYLLKDRQSILINTIVVNFGWGLYALLFGLQWLVVQNLINAVRLVILRYTNAWWVILSLAFAAGGSVFLIASVIMSPMINAVSVLASMASFMATIAFGCSEPYMIRRVLLAAVILWITHHWLTQSLPQMVAALMVLVFVGRKVITERSMRSKGACQGCQSG